MILSLTRDVNLNRSRPCLKLLSYIFHCAVMFSSKVQLQYGMVNGNYSVVAVVVARLTDNLIIYS